MSFYEVSSDGRTVWVNGVTFGHCVARFCPVSAEYIDADTGRPKGMDRPPDWGRFVERVEREYGVPSTELQAHKPRWVGLPR